MPPTPPPKSGPKAPGRPPQPAPALAPTVMVAAPLPGPTPGPNPPPMPVGVAVTADGSGRSVTARQAGGLLDLALPIDPEKAGVKAALQNMAKSINIAFQSAFGENQLESVYQAAIVRRGEVVIVHREYFGFGDNWFGQFGMLVRSLQLTCQGADPASPEGQKYIREKGPETIRGLLNLIGRKLDLVAEYEDKVPAFVEQMFDRLEATGIITGWDRSKWEITTTRIGLNVRIRPATDPDAEAS